MRIARCIRTAMPAWAYITALFGRRSVRAARFVDARIRPPDALQSVGQATYRQPKAALAASQEPLSAKAETPHRLRRHALELKRLDNLLPLAETIAARLKARGETIVVAESSTGGLISAALLAVPGASAYFLGGVVSYTRQAKQLLLGIDDAALGQIRSATPPHALLLARHARAQFAATWGLAETGAAGPSGNRHGDPAGHTCLAIAGTTEVAVTVETGNSDRIANMYAFAVAALELMARVP